MYNSYRKINTFLNGDRNEFDISKALVATDKKDKRDSKQILNTLNESKHLSNVKTKFENKGEEINQRKTVVFKQSYKNLDEINEKGFASFSAKQNDNVNFPECQNNITYKGIGDGIGGMQAIEANNGEAEAISDDVSEDAK